MDSQILWLRETFSHMGQHSGYDQLCTTLEQEHPNDYSSVWCDRAKTPKGTGRLLAKLMASPSSNPLYNSASALAELKAIWQIRFHRIQQLHVLYVEDGFRIIAKQKSKIRTRIIGTVHQPPGWWRSIHGYPQELSTLDELIVLSSNSVEYFDKYLPGRVHFIPHGVDTSFFSPISSDFPSRQSNNLNCIFVGQWLRDFDTLIKVIERVIEKNPTIHFNLVIPIYRRHLPEFQLISRHSQVRWYTNLSDQDLRDLYRQSDLLFLPLIDCTANNAILEAMACGLPIVSNAVGGAVDYTQPTFANLLPSGDIVGMSEAILSLADDLEECRRRGTKSRIFVEENFSWQKVAEQVSKLYDSKS
ncbi:glycosyltransferase family 4 protein [Calothrix sp. PCC 7507]|uniref:glycosyltransferase family 4 protein n=1 Tax=Calothrix sp. PCC 7507 TaxID=99598 RepID=UPI00029F36EE|nr:glycosyltransferase family 4 protein [Calothrix sp. PCC 7507]AFY30874.1 glycosyl transferase group 1 [Calothrix sp. PCC 7507]